MNDSSDDRAGQGTQGTERAAAGGQNKIPRGVEILVKRASVDSAFRQALIERRSKAAREIGLVLSVAERAMLDAVPVAQLEGIIEHTKVSEAEREALLRQGDDAASSAFPLSDSRPPGYTGRTRGIRPHWEDRFEDGK